MIGLIGKKVGMTQVFDEKGKVTPVTVVRVEPNLVIGHRVPDRDGYSAVILGTDEMKESRAAKPYSGQFKDGAKPQKCLIEMRDFEKDTNPGDVLGVELFEDVSFIDVTGTSKGKGTQGVMKRWGFGGGRKTHGSKFHRENGSTGQSAYPSKTIKGLKMSGRMGFDRVTVQNLRVVKVDAEKQVILVKGAVPGRKNTYLVLAKAKKKG
ncbi:50S ribosomal protein L3 [Spirochaeta lutea]|uniref:Large ribosomal subunit protein uL3 n=1 Tax=Spirochaeta lutea TaxID=1480694 RepID=A0A098QS36_9SPIO|nr:50S ribosomal protein L3 [Spirochaeta lutea]KGE70690.1 50S ribosomal protein L3 [Spirochaeta lutea]